VGPSTAELESLNELIRFDHVYYKSSADTVAKVTDIAAVKNADSLPAQQGASTVVLSIPTTTAPKRVVSLLPKIDTAIATTTQTALPSVVSEPPVSSPVDLPVDMSISDFLDLSETLNKLVDIDNILQADMPPLVEQNTDLISSVAMTATSNSAALSVKSVMSQDSEPACKRQRLDVPCSSPVSLSPVASPLNLFSDDLDMFSMVNDSTMKSSVSESGYSSDGMVASPHSDLSSGLEEDGWEDSFTELFPALV